MVIAIYVSKQGDNFNPTPVYMDTAEKIQIASVENNTFIYVSKQGDNFNPIPLYKDTAEKIQVADLDNKGNKVVMVSKDGKNFETAPAFNNTAANLKFVLSQSTKSIYVSKDGKNFETAPAYSDTVLNFKIEFAGGQGQTGITGKNIYKTTGKSQTPVSTGIKTRHYASGKPDDKTIEFNAEDCPYEAYEAYGYFTIGQPEHDDRLDVKFYGPHHKKGKGAWYIFAIQFSDGQTSCGYEKPHPKTTSDVVKGKAFGDIRGNKEIGFKGVIWPLAGGGAHVEGYIDMQDGKGWQLGISADNIGGKEFEKDDNQQVQFRIDAAPELKGREVIVEEIAVPPQKVA